MRLQFPIEEHIRKASTLEKVCLSKNKKSCLLKHLEKGFRGKSLQFMSVLLLPFWFSRIIWPKIFHSFWFLTRKEFVILFVKSRWSQLATKFDRSGYFYSIYIFLKRSVPSLEIVLAIVSVWGYLLFWYCLESQDYMWK